MILSKLVPLLALLVCVLADVSITAPKASQTFSVSGSAASVAVKWKDTSDDSSDDDSLKNVEKYVISLCTGPNDGIECLISKTVADADSKSYSFLIEETDVASGYYYFQVYATFKDGYSIHYSQRFLLKGFSGSIKTYTAVTDAKATTARGDPPMDQISVGDSGGSVNSKSFSITYTKQTGKTRFAPMQTQPGTKITHSKYSRRFPTSAVTYYSTKHKTPSILTTITPGRISPKTSYVNWASPAPDPTGAVAASERVTKWASLTTGSKRKRWLD